jgi:hypothetical protein
MDLREICEIGGGGGVNVIWGSFLAADFGCSSIEPLGSCRVCIGQFMQYHMPYLLMCKPHFLTKIYHPNLGCNLYMEYEVFCFFCIRKPISSKEEP